MDFVVCCVNEDDKGANSYTVDITHSLMTFSDSLDSIEDQANILECDYKEVTPLFKAIEQEDWKSVLIFLTTGRWSNSSLSSSYMHMTALPADSQVRTWVKCNGGKKGENSWRQLPIHAAISYQAPLPVIQKLVENYHEGLRCKDDTGNLPLHLAFGFGCPDPVVAFLIKEFPQALSIRGLQKRKPVDCCELGPNKVRGDILRAIEQHTRVGIMKDWELHWKKSLADAQQKAGIKDPGVPADKTIEEVFSEFMQVKLELEKIRELAKSRPTMIITKTEPIPESPKSMVRSPSEITRMFSFGRRQGTGKGRGATSVAGINRVGSKAKKRTLLPPGLRQTFSRASISPSCPPLGGQCHL